MSSANKASILLRGIQQEKVPLLLKGNTLSVFPFNNRGKHSVLLTASQPEFFSHKPYVRNIQAAMRFRGRCAIVNSSYSEKIRPDTAFKRSNLRSWTDQSAKRSYPKIMVQ